MVREEHLQSDQDGKGPSSLEQNHQHKPSEDDEYLHQT